jgi:hypothetical protein
LPFYIAREMPPSGSREREYPETHVPLSEQMKIEIQSGSDTEMLLVNIYLETERESALSHQQIWIELRPLLDAHQIHLGDVVDFYLYRRGPDQKWISGGELTWGTQ